MARTAAAVPTVAGRNPVPERGEAMRALPAKWQAAVDALFLTAGDVFIGAVAGWMIARRATGPRRRNGMPADLA
jgi:hypothetical protein